MKLLMAIGVGYYAGAVTPFTWTPIAMLMLGVVALAIGWANALEAEAMRKVNYVTLPPASARRRDR